MNKTPEHLTEPSPVRISNLPRWKADSGTPDPGFATLWVLCGTLCLVVLFWPFFGSHFDLTASDPGDGRFELTILEHWVKVFHQQAPVASPNFFYPEKGILGNSDSFFGLALLHAMFRSFGADRYLAVQFATMLLAALGFVAMYYLLRGVLHFPRSTSLIGATLFVISDMYYVYVVHPYILGSVVIAPLLFLLVGKYWQQKETKPARAVVYLCLSATLLALIFYTSYYIGWYLVLCTAAAVLFYTVCRVFAERSSSPISRILKAAWQQKWSFLLAGVVFLLSMVPFFALYLPTLHRTGKRSLGETIVFMPRALGIFDVGRDNLVWGRISARIEDWVIPGSFHEHPTGWPLLTIVVFLATAFYCGLQLLRSRHKRNHAPRPMLCLISAIALTCLTLWTAGVRVGAHAPVWLLLTRFVPGAAAIRVPQRIDLVLNIGVVIVCMFGLELLRKRLSVYGSFAFVVVLLLAGALGVEQLNTMQTHLLSRSGEAQKFARIPPPPKECTSFFVSDWSNSAAQMMVNQTDGMMVAQQYNIPTLNGNSSWFPAGWNLLGAAHGHVAAAAMDWANKNGISDGLCSLEVDWGTWKPAAEEAQEEASAHVNQPISGEITNSSFEDSDMSSWARYQYVRATIATPQAHSGSYSLAESEATGSVYQDVPGLQAGQRYRISAWVSASPGATAGAYIAVFDIGANVATLSQTVHPGGDWQLLSQEVTIKNGGTLRIHLFRTEGTGTIFWDDVSIHPDNGSDIGKASN